MSSVKIFSVIVISFLLGFFTNEYLALFKKPKSIGNEQLQTNINALPANVQLAQHAPADSNNPSVAQKPNGFSWERVNHLIELTNYDDGVRLLKDYLHDNDGSAQAWLLLANIYQKQERPIPALDAWFHYLKLESDAKKIEQALVSIKSYLTYIADKPTLFDNNFLWLSEQLNTLLGFNPNDSELHVLIASVYLNNKDDYQAQYHALMAVNDPATRQRAEDILAQLNGEEKVKDVVVPLTRFGTQFLVNVNIEGNPARLLLDTGASISGVTGNYILKYPGIVKSTKPIRMNTAGGVRETYLFTVDSLSVDNIVFNQHILSALPMENMTEFDGLFGVDILGRYDFVIDQNAALLRLNTRKK